MSKDRKTSLKKAGKTVALVTTATGLVLGGVAFLFTKAFLSAMNDSIQRKENEDEGDEET